MAYGPIGYAKACVMLLRVLTRRHGRHHIGEWSQSGHRYVNCGYSCPEL
jgi:hypothetical protein